VQGTILRTLGTVAATLCFSFPSALAATADSKVMYFYCYGPQTAGGVPPPAKVYISGVSSTVYTEANRDAASNEFRQFIAAKFGADFEPRCEYSGTELAATKLLSMQKGRYRDAAVMTGWTWPGAAAPAQHPDS
jgi:hypothetical protein